jgi:diacylglycerol kinase family enzyme
VTQSIPLVVNPIAGGGRLLRFRLALDAAAAAAGVRLEWWPTEGPGHGEELAARAVREGRELVLAFGGDGTYNEVARGLVGSRTALGVLPGGTTSVLAYEFGIPRPAPRALAALIAGSDRAMRVGRTSRDEVFLLMLSAGPDSMVLTALMPSLKRLGGKVGIALQAVIELIRWQRLPSLHVCLEDEVLTCGWAIVGKSRCYAGRWKATPGADPFTPELELVALRGTGRGAAVPFALGMATGAHVRRRDVVRTAIERVRLEPADGLPGLRYQIDGDLRHPLPVEAWVDPEPLVVRVPVGR